ncbi:MAG: RsmB/NOP family class I SAM-dependent RNA methyltransferase, partial [Ignisphaera sp.]
EPATEVQKIDDDVFLSKIINDTKVNKICDDALNLAKKYGYLPYMVQRYINILGYEETIKLLNTFEHYVYRPAILCNNLKIDCSLLIEKLTSLGFELRPIPWHRYGYVVTRAISSPTLGSTHEFLKGFYYVYRDVASLLPILALSPIPGSKVLDMCAAPGGKSVHILLSMMDKGLLVANEISKIRIKSLVANFFRMGLKSYVVISEDATLLPKKIDDKFDYILVDAPCSAEGAIMFDKSRKTKTTQEDLAKLVLKEIKLLLSAIIMAKPGARIVYTTCSIAPEENEYVITRVLDLVGDDVVDIESINIGVGDSGLRKFNDLEFNDKVVRCIRIWPHKHLMEGYFLCSLNKL